jgi:2-isopropylmalate synthase
MSKRIYIYDTTLRDGAQTKGVDFSVVDKLDITQKLDEFGIDYVEAGWPGANPTDDQFFETPPELSAAKLTAFGMTRKVNTSAENDPGLAALVNCGTPTITIFGKSWDFHTTDALGITLEENLEMVGSSIAFLTSRDKEVMFDAEHFFDGYKANKEYALSVIKSAHDNGARWIVLCDTNGGTLPHEISEIVSEVIKNIPGEKLGIHCHNDTGNGVANALAAVRAGVRQVQGTINGLGERCGNTNLVSVIPNLVLKMGFDTGISEEKLTQLSSLSHYLCEKLNQSPFDYAPYVGANAFAHKGGVHVSAVEKNSKSYEHVKPESVGNIRQIIMSNQAGRANVLRHLRDVGIEIDSKDKKISELVQKVKDMENIGYSYDGANASFEILARRILEDVPQFFRMAHFQVVDDREWSNSGELKMSSKADVTLDVNGNEISTSAQGNGPVNALDTAIHKALANMYPEISEVKLVDYKVRIINPESGTEAVTRVIIESADEDGNRWSTVGVSANVIDASYNALRDSLIYRLLKSRG